MAKVKKPLVNSVSLVDPCHLDGGHLLMAVGNSMEASNGVGLPTPWMLSLP